jgi:lipopolysaccharide transport system ATP-binding protein
MAEGQQFTCEFQIERVSLGCGHYSIAIALHESDSHLVNNHDWWEHALVFQVLRADEPVRIGVANLAVRSVGIVAASVQAERR